MLWQFLNHFYWERKEVGGKPDDVYRERRKCSAQQTAECA